MAEYDDLVAEAIAARDAMRVNQRRRTADARRRDEQRKREQLQAHIADMKLGCCQDDEPVAQAAPPPPPPPPDELGGAE